MADTFVQYSDAAIAMLRASLGFYDTEIPEALLEHLKSLLNQAFRQLARADIHLATGKLYDDQLQVMYAAWLYRNGATGAAKPPMLAQEIRDRQVENALTAADEEEIT